MGEANRRRRADQTPQEEVFENIAAVVDTLPPSLSDCTFKALVAYQAARSFGLDDVSIGIGGLLARVGPDPVRDVITWCDSQNMGAINDSGALFLHCWLRYRDTIFDATVGDWRSVDATAAEERLGAVSLPPIQWTVTFPTYWLKRTSEVETPWRPEGRPAMGRVWYCPPRPGEADRIKSHLQELHELAGLKITTTLNKLSRDAAAELGLPHEGDNAVYPLKFSVRTV
jgi:hypothetical protein